MSEALRYIHIWSTWKHFASFSLFVWWASINSLLAIITHKRILNAINGVMSVNKCSCILANSSQVRDSLLVRNCSIFYFICNVTKPFYALYVLASKSETENSSVPTPNWFLEVTTYLKKIISFATSQNPFMLQISLRTARFP